jgi:cell filamentation protein
MNKYRYEPPDNYCCPGTDVLINKFDIGSGKKLRIVERKFTAARLFELGNSPLRGRFGFTHLKKIHAYIFQDLYDWARKPRAAGFLASAGRLFCRGEYIDSNAAEIFGKLQGEKLLRNLPQADFVSRLACFMGEVNALHPLREGNGRAAREFWRELSLKAGYVLDWGSTDKQELFAADVAAYDKEYAPLTAILARIVIPVVREDK